MPLLYLDASIVVAAIVREAATKRVQAFLKQQGPGALRISRWAITEYSSALALKMRTGEMDSALFASAHARLPQFLAGVGTLEVDAKAFELAAVFCQRHQLGLRAGDALHLAVAAAHGCTLVTLDARMAKAAPDLGVQVAEI